MKKNIKTLSIVLASINLFGCGGSSSDDLSPSGSPSVNIRSVDVVGATAQDGSNAIVISPYVNEGEFTVAWDVRTSGANISSSYILRLYFSDEPMINESSLRIVQSQCGYAPDVLTGCDGTKNQATCSFNSSNIVDCGGRFPKTNASSFIGELPMNAYLVVEACSGPFSTDPCQYDSFNISLQ